MPPPPSPPGLKALHARLWDDPLVVAYQHSQKEKSKNESKSEREKTDSPAKQTAIQRDMQEVVEGFIAPANSLDGASGQPTSKVLVMPVFVLGEPFGDDTENRKRITYAVLSA